MFKFYYFKIYFVATMLLFNFSLNAAKSYTWDGSVSNNWNTNGNWDANPGSNGNGVYLVEGPGTYTNAPIISNSPSFTMNDLGISGGTNLSMTGGTITIPGDFAIAEGSDFVISGGTINIQGSLFIADDGSSISVSGGDIVVSGDINMGSTDGVNSSVGSDGATSMTVSSGNVSCSNLVYSNETGDTHSVSLSGGTLQVSGDVRSDGEDIILNLSGTGIMTIGDDLLMTGGNDQLNMSNGILTVAGDWNNQGNSSITGGNILLNGFFTQNISNTDGITFYNLTVDNGIGSIELNDSIIISNSLTLTNGIINTNGNTVTFVDNSQVSGASNFSFINGAVNKIGNNAFTFPLGSGSFYRPIRISAPNSVSEFYQANYFKSNPNGLYPLINKEAGIFAVSQVEYWTLDKLVGSSSDSVILSWSSSSLVGKLADLLVCRWDVSTSEWKNEGNGGTAGNTNSGTITSSGKISNFSPFTLGSSSPSNPLPVELIEFNVTKTNDVAMLKWKTASEINNSCFLIERTYDRVNIEQLGRIETKAENGNSIHELNYSFQDKLSQIGTVYYRLKQMDHDGKIKTYPFKSLSGEGFKSNKRIRLYPNPAIDYFIVEYENLDKTDIALKRINGEFHPINTVQENLGAVRCSLSGIKKGVYIVSILDKETNKVLDSEKLIVN